MLRRCSNKTLCPPGPRGHTDWARHAFECLSVSCRGMSRQWPARGTVLLAAADLGHAACHRHTASSCSRPGTCSLGHKPSWRRLPLAPPYSPWTDNPQISEQLYQTSSCTVKDSSRIHSRFLNLGIWQGDWEIPGNLTLEASGIWL